MESAQNQTQHPELIGESRWVRLDWGRSQRELVFDTQRSL